MLISTPDDARQLISKEDFSLDDARSLCLYFIQRDEQWRESTKILSTLLFALIQTFHPVLMGLQQLLAQVDDIEKHKGLLEAIEESLEAINSARAKITPPDDSSVH